ncbi:MAG: hypothetical protein ACLRSH_09300 [Turicibacter sp.]
MSKQGRTRTISFPKRDYDIKEYLGKLDNMSEYLISLVRENLTKRGIEIDSEGNVISVDEHKGEKDGESDRKLDQILDSIDELKELIKNRTFSSVEGESLKPKVEVKLNRLLNSLLDDDE